MEFVDFVLSFDDPDPWAVSGPEWRERLDEFGRLPDGWYVLDDPGMRASIRDMDLPLSQAIREIDRFIAERSATPVEENESATKLPVGPVTVAMARVLRLRRISARQNLRAICRATGITPTMLSRIENMKRGISLDELDALARALGTTVAALFEEARAGTGPR